MMIHVIIPAAIRQTATELGSIDAWSRVIKIHTGLQKYEFHFPLTIDPSENRQYDC